MKRFTIADMTGSHGVSSPWNSEISHVEPLLEVAARKVLDIGIAPGVIILLVEGAREGYGGGKGFCLSVHGGSHLSSSPRAVRIFTFARRSLCET